ncbi:MAG: pilus assembly protein TadG-related protein, partial [Candidatus Binataceae bacterium]
FARKASGQTFVLVSIALVVLLGMAALAVDVGDLWTTRRLMQSAADAGAVAGADEVAIGGGGSDITAAAKDAASHNGFADGATRPGASSTVTVAVHNPPTSGPFAANSSAVQVDVSQTQNTYFMRILGWRAVPVSTTAVAVTTGSGSCVYSLDKHQSGAITVGGSATVNSACGLYDNSDSSSALTVSGGGTITSPLVGVVGGTNVNGGGSTPPTTGIAQFGDPLAYIAAPSFDPSSCPSFSTQNISGAVGPGTFCGGIKINAGSTVTFSPGLYIIDGGGLQIVGGATVSGTGVTFYLTGVNNNNGNKKSYGGVDIASTATVNLSSPCDSSGGGIPGMLFFQDRSETNGVGSTINGSASSTFSGAIYFPTTALAYAGSTGANMFTLLVADTMSFLGNSTVNNDFSCLSDQRSLILDAALVQ